MHRNQPHLVCTEEGFVGSHLPGGAGAGSAYHRTVPGILLVDGHVAAQGLQRAVIRKPGRAKGNGGELISRCQELPELTPPHSHPSQKWNLALAGIHCTVAGAELGPRHPQQGTKEDQGTFLRLQAHLSLRMPQT